MGNLKHFYKKELDNASFAHDVTYSDSKHLAKRPVLDRILKDSAYEIARNCKYDGYQKRSASMVYKFLKRKQDRERMSKLVLMILYL